MSIETLLRKVRDTVPPSVWGAAVELARSGAVQGVHDDGDELCLRVKGQGKALPHEVYLWPDDEDWGCDCQLPGACCVHVSAAVISVNQTPDEEQRLPASEKEMRVQLRYDFESQGTALSLQRTIVYPDGRTEALRGTLASSNLLVDRGDAQAESLLAMQPKGPLKAEILRRLLVFLEGKPAATLDGKKVRLSTDPFMFRVALKDADEGFKAALYRPEGVTKLYRGAATRRGVLAPTSHGGLTATQRRQLMEGVYFGPQEVGKLVRNWIPRMRTLIDVTIDTDRLPQTSQLRPAVLTQLSEQPQGLRVLGQVVYGDPPVAKVERGVLKILGDVIPARDMGAERIVAREFEERTGLMVGHPHTLMPERAANFLQEVVPGLPGPVHGKVAEDRFRVEDVDWVPEIHVREGSSDNWQLDVSFLTKGGQQADTDTLLRAWRSGTGLVSLMDGGFAPLPSGWLERYGNILRELWEERNERGEVSPYCAPAIAELLDDEQEWSPPDLTRLKTFLDEGDGLAETPLPEDFQGELRSYQQVGVDWMQFLAGMGFHGILADDMGLGKTIQTLVNLSVAGGPHLVVAPTSVLRNWEKEAKRFVPNLTLNVYHGPRRKLVDADITLTSYALMRIDVAKLSKKKWKYAVLDEAQFIKNPRSKTAQAAYCLDADHRLALTGTPVENRLEELWSQFRFLMPGLLGGLEAFRDQFTKPIENGDKASAVRLKKRIQPYVLRRLKRQVATELPPLTEMVVRCEMGSDQRGLYDAVRLGAQQEVVKGAGTMQILEALLRMRQACCDPALLPGDTGADMDSCKLDQLEDMLVELVCGGHKALVFSQWTSFLDRVELRLKSLEIDWVRLDGATRDRQAPIDAFQDPNGPPVFLLSLKAGGTGLNLTAADYVLLLDPWWNPAVERQATDRAHRIGQTKPVVCCRFIAAGTVEERIMELQEAKRGLADSVVGTEGGFVRHLSASELRSLFEDHR